MPYLRPVQEMSLVTRFFDLPQVSQNYRAAGRARSKAEFIAKIGIVIEEADETVLWLELLAQGNILPAAKLEGVAHGSKTTAGHFFCLRRTAKK